MCVFVGTESAYLAIFYVHLLLFLQKMYLVTSIAGLLTFKVAVRILHVVHVSSALFVLVLEFYIPSHPHIVGVVERSFLHRGRHALSRLSAPLHQSPASERIAKSLTCVQSLLSCPQTASNSFIYSLIVHFFSLHSPILPSHISQHAVVSRE